MNADESVGTYKETYLEAAQSSPKKLSSTAV
jgi:hypothetical protein